MEGGFERVEMHFFEKSEPIMMVIEGILGVLLFPIFFAYCCIFLYTLLVYLIVMKTAKKHSVLRLCFPPSVALGHCAARHLPQPVA